VRHEIPSNTATRHLYGFKLSARARAWIEERKGHTTIIKHELVKPDGSLLQWLYTSTNPISLVPFYETWPDAQLAWTVYVERRQVEKTMR
jgi:hypothetical protein